MLNELMKDAVSKLVLKDIQHELDNVKVLYEDNQRVIQLTENLQHHNKSKHINIKYHYIRELITSQAIL